MDYKNENNWLMYGDCLDRIKDLPDNSVDLWVTSPPYAEQRDYDGASSEKYIEFIAPIIASAASKLKSNGIILVNIKEHCTDGQRDLYVLKMIIHFVEVLGLRFVDEFIWNKTNPFPTGSKIRLKDGYERILHFTKEKNHKFYPDSVLVKSESKWLAGELKRANKGAHNTTNGSGMNMSKRIANEYVRPSNVLTLSSSNINIGHPAVYPEGIPEFFIKLMTQEGDLVGDMFMGSGTTGIVANRLNRRFVGIEKDETYFNMSKDRVVKSSCNLNFYFSLQRSKPIVL